MKSARSCDSGRDVSTRLQPRRPNATTVRQVIVAGAIAFLRRDPVELGRCADNASCLPPPYGAFCHGLLSTVHAAITGDGERVRALFTALERSSRRLGCPRLVRLGRALAVEAHVIAGLSAPVKVPGADHATRTIPALDRLFLEWHRSAVSRDRALESRQRAQLRERRRADC